MKLTIDGKDYPVPTLNVADFEEYEELIRKAADNGLHFMDRNRAIASVIVAKMQATYAELEAKPIKQAIPLAKLHDLFKWSAYGKNGEAKPQTVESPNL